MRKHLTEFGIHFGKGYAKTAVHILSRLTLSLPGNISVFSTGKIFSSFTDIDLFFCKQEPSDEIMEMLDRKKKEALAYKRSFFVRMVSDPKIYNPKIAKGLPPPRNQLTDPNSAVSINAPM